MLTEKKIKSCSLSIKDVDDTKGVVVFYASSFDDKKDSYGDIVLPGAFKKTLEENNARFKHLYNHQKTIGVIQEISEDKKGLLVSSKLSKSTAGADAMIEYKEGIITEHSFGYKTIREDFDKKTETNYLKELKLWEVSSLDKWGANDNTPTVGIKSMEDIAGQIKSIEKIIRNSSISDERAIELLKRVKSLSKYLKSLAPNQPGKPTGSAAQAINFNYLSNNFKL